MAAEELSYPLQLMKKPLSNHNVSGLNAARYRI